MANKLAQYLDNQGEKTLAADVRERIEVMKKRNDISKFSCTKLDDIADLALEIFVKKKSPKTPTERGAQVAKDLIGCTTYKEAQRVRNNIEKINSPEDTIEFLRSYHNNSFGGDDFFTQIITEDMELGFGDRYRDKFQMGRENLIRTIATKLEQYLRDHEHSDLADSVKEVLAGKIDEKSCQILDKIANQLLLISG